MENLVFFIYFCQILTNNSHTLKMHNISPCLLFNNNSTLGITLEAAVLTTGKCVTFRVIVCHGTVEKPLGKNACKEFERTAKSKKVLVTTGSRILSVIIIRPMSSSYLKNRISVIRQTQSTMLYP